VDNMTTLTLAHPVRVKKDNNKVVDAKLR
jgi:hypothetical protein